MRRAVLFDLDDTILVDEPDVDGCFRRVTADVDEAAGVDSGTVAASVRAAAREVWRASPLAAEARRLGFSSWEGLAADFVGGHPVVEPFRKWVPTFRQASWTTGLEPFDAADRSGDLAQRYRQERRSAYRLFPDALEVLTLVRAAGWLLGIVTNGPPDLQREKVQTTGLNEYVDVVAVSGEVGAGKPERAIFEFVLSRLDVPPSTAVMVGDSVERDMKGAQHLGMRTIWRRSPGRAKEWQPAVASLRDLPNLLDMV
ncbi:MAG: HAD family hydrolase [Actinomycetota bacterium]|nr:HAD family hydrolase [Actinomycetota bacterium]